MSAPGAPHDRARRLKAFEPCSIEQGGSAFRAHVLNISHSGALVHAAGTMATGSKIVLVCGSLKIPGRIAWVDGARAGVAFDYGIPAIQLEQVFTGEPSRQAQPVLRCS